MSIFGQNPADITGALFKAKNFADVPDKAAARTNLDVPSKAEVQYNSIPVGMILPFWGSVAPLGYVPCSGQTVTSASFPELVTFLGGGASQVVPDLRGEFLRGWDNGRGVDVGRNIFSLQLDDFKSHTHALSGTILSTAGGASGNPTAWTGTPAWTSSPTGGTETRPRNVSVLYCIKAYSSVTNFTSGVNIAGLVNDYSTLSASAAKYADFTGTNQGLTGNGWQKLPGGLIIQWGAVSTPVNGITAVTFPLVFPNAFTTLTASYGGATTPVNSILCSYGLPTVSGFNAYLTSVASNAGQTTTGGFRWVAIGY